MSIDTRLTVDLQDLMAAIDIPSPSIDAIRGKIERADVVSMRPRPRASPGVAVAAALALAMLALPQMSPALMQTLEMRYREALAALGGSAPPAPQKSLVDRLAVSDATLASAQSRVTFTIAPPSGLPKDIVSSSIETAPTGRYSPAQKTWSVGAIEVRFTYRRASGASFTLIATPYDPALRPSRVLFEAKDPDASGKPVLIKHENFAWRNGTQLMTVPESDALRPAEIDAIRSAMHGEPVAMRALHQPGTGGFVRLRRP